MENSLTDNTVALLSALAGGFAAPQPCFPAQKSGKAAPGAAFLSCLFYTISLKVKLMREQKMEISGDFLTTR